jgi:hypothetical protein
MGRRLQLLPLRLSGNQAIAKFGLPPEEFARWNSICCRIAGLGQRLRRQQSALPQAEEWLGIYAPGTTLPVLVFQGALAPQIHPHVSRITLHYFLVPDGFEVQAQS